MVVYPPGLRGILRDPSVCWSHDRILFPLGLDGRTSGLGCAPAGLGGPLGKVPSGHTGLQGAADGSCDAFSVVGRGDVLLDGREGCSLPEVVVRGAGGDAHLVVTHLEILVLES